MNIDLLTFKELLGIIAIIITFIAFIPYIRSILLGVTKPHVFSWIIWGTTTFVVFIAQLSDGGGAGSWAMGISGIVTILIAILSYFKKADNSITKTDWIFFVLAMSAIPLWYVTSNPLWAVITLTIIDTIGMFPTIRKAYVKPFEEQILLYVVMSVRNIIAIAALEYYSVTTILFPATITVTCLILVIVIILGRRKNI